jgi:two-component system OmpR family response regulator
MNLLLIEDDPDIPRTLCQTLAPIYTIQHAQTGSDGLDKARSQSYDAIILDLTLPDMSGLTVCQKLRAANIHTPILILSGEAKIISKITLLDAGADDYLTKPFSLGELKARLRVLIRKSSAVVMEGNKITLNSLTLDMSTHRVERDGQAIALRRKEFSMLECLMKHAGTVVTRDVLTTHAWRANESPWTNTVDVHIKYLRDKVDRPFEQPLIKTVHGIGYKLER